MINIVEENQKHYTQQKYERSKIVREIYQTVDYPFIKDYKNIIKVNTIKNCPVTIEYIDIFGEIFGPDIYTLKVNTVNTKPKAVVDDYIDILQELKDTHQNIYIFDDIIYIRGQMFLLATSKTIRHQAGD